ncbi:MAG: hypothetical protein ACRDBG_28235 [Waterburya sp.]
MSNPIPIYAETFMPDGSVEREVVGYEIPTDIHISRSQLYLALTQVQKLEAVLTFVRSLPETHPGRILFETAENYKRSNPMWDQFASVLSMTPQNIDSIFEAAEMIVL